MLIANSKSVGIWSIMPFIGAINNIIPICDPRDGFPYLSVSLSDWYQLTASLNILSLIFLTYYIKLPIWF